MSKTPDAEIQALLADLWQRHLPTLRERVGLLESAATLAEASGSIPEETRAGAQSAAHNLAGNLGMFGHSSAGEIAGQIEQILKAPTPATLSGLAALVARLREALAANL
ncbi:Hpt domain-containing protein [Edaphobacter bradus]|uniref:Hpt domain-containing protein n=1 Tax=Edaphobacter bradus TaxID=2259016 RepID=UPI0021DFCB42|nr:Hpt domain-containing protein [Edaphobacter bradus]